MKNFAKYAMAAVVAAGMAISAQALNITPATLPQWTGSDTGQPQINAAIAPIIGTATELYKQNVGGGESGALAGSYTTTFSNSATDPADALIEYDGGNYVGGTAWLLVKDGNSNPAWYLFNLTTLGWNGTDDLVLTGFWPNKGAISHVTLYGTPTPPEEGNVPDAGTTMALFGLGLGALGFARRKLA